MRWFLASLICLLGCAGPTTPFGAVSVTETINKIEQKISKREEAWNFSASKAVRSPQNLENSLVERVVRSEPKIFFKPERQVLHKKSLFSMMIEDPEGITKNHDLKVFYNGFDVTQSLLRRADTAYLDNNRKFLIQFTDLRMRAVDTNEIWVSYRHSSADKPVVAEFQSPRCSAFHMSPIVHTEDFTVSADLLALLERKAKDENINQGLLAAMMAQESGFNPEAVSHAKALGLMQITSLGEAEIIKEFSQWPRYPEIGEMPVPLVKFNVTTKKINGSNEWRLNPELSVQGGIAYIKFLNEYWKKDPPKFLENSEELDWQLSRLILASYNSGAYRVSKSIDSLGEKWISDPNIEEARKYVNRVMSYCDHFATQREDL